MIDEKLCKRLYAHDAHRYWTFGGEMQLHCPGVVVDVAAEGLARRFHETYERLAPSFGYRTREASAKPWDEVPEDNRHLMIAVCAEILSAQRPAEGGPERCPSKITNGMAVMQCVGRKEPFEHLHSASEHTWLSGDENELVETSSAEGGPEGEGAANHSLAGIEYDEHMGWARSRCSCGWEGDWSDEGGQREEHAAHAQLPAPAALDGGQPATGEQSNA
jgi:hypothetical protein